MAYNVADIIEKAIKIAVKRKAIYESIGQEKSDNLSIKIMSNVLVKQMDKSIILGSREKLYLHKLFS